MKTQPYSDSNQTSLLTTKQLLDRIPVCSRTLDNWKASGVLPFIKIGRQCLYDWEHVRAALLRNERGGSSQAGNSTQRSMAEANRQEEEPWVKGIRAALHYGRGGKQ